ncbi:MAG: F0F1 ATP synthase subunit B [Chloroflexi bacterium]|nr:F0F1 ATP synthase subunit B [Chloroflexota bacterium]
MEALGINLGFFIAQLVNFGIIFFLLARGVWPRVTKMLDERAAKIAQQLEDARAAEEARENAERERDKMLAQARGDGQKLVEEARQRGEEQVKQILRDAATEAEQQRAAARAQAEEERNRILADTRDQIAALAISATERLIGDGMDEKRAKSVLKRFFSEAPAEAKGLGKQITVISAVPLADDEKSDVKKLTGADQIEYKVDPAILGGLVIRAGDKVVDGSVRGDLSALSAQLR